MNCEPKNERGLPYRDEPHIKRNEQMSEEKKSETTAVATTRATAPATKPTEAEKGAIVVKQNGHSLPECKLITRLDDKGADCLRKVILQLSGNDPLFVEKFVECCKMQVNKHWKCVNGTWSNPFLVIPLNSQLEALYKCASRKVLPDGYNANLVPYIGRDEKKVEVVIDYKGLIDCAVREKIILDADAKEVCKNDIFVWNCGEVTSWTFDIRRPRGGICGYCGWIVMPDGRKKWHYMANDEIAEVAKCAKTANVWNKWRGEMSKKTVIRRMFKTIRNTPNLVAMMDVDNDSYALEDEGDEKETTPMRSVYGDPNKKTAERRQANQLELAKERNVSHGDPLADEPEAGVEVVEPEKVPVAALTADGVAKEDDLFA